MTHFQLLVSIALPWCLGSTVVLFLFRKNPLPAAVTAALGYGLGAGLLTFWMLLLTIFKIPFAVKPIGLPLAVFCLLLSFSLLRHKKIPSKRNHVTRQTEKFQAWDILLMLAGCYILYITIYVLWRSLNVPMQHWDEVATIAYQAKIFFYEKSMELLKVLPRRSYPPNIPLLETWTALNLSRWDDQLVKIIFPGVYLSYLIIHFWFLAQYSCKRWALLGIALLVSSNLFIAHATSAYRDFFLMYYNCTTVLLLMIWYKKGQNSLLLLAALLSGLGTFTKMEGFFYLAIHSFLLAVMLWTRKDLSMRSRISKFLYFAIPGYAIFGLYFGYRMTMHIAMDPGAKIIFNWDWLQRAPIFFDKIFQDMFLTGNWNILWLLLIISLLRKKIFQERAEIIWLLLVLILHFTSMAFLCLFSKASAGLLGTQWFTVIPRLILHVYPLSIVLIVLLNAPGKAIDSNNFPANKKAAL